MNREHFLKSMIGVSAFLTMPYSVFKDDDKALLQIINASSSGIKGTMFGFKDDPIENVKVGFVGLGNRGVQLLSLFEWFIKKNDTINHYTLPMFKYRYEVSLFAGWQWNSPNRHDNLSEVNWIQSTNHQLHMQNNFRAGAHIRFSLNDNILLQTGLEVEQFNIEGRWEYRKNPGNAPPHASAQQDQTYRYSSTYFLLSAPVHLLYLRQWNDYYIQAGSGVNISFSHAAEKGNNNYEDYIDHIDHTGYYEQHPSLMVGVLLHCKGGYFIHQQTAIHLDLSYRQYLTPLFSNTLYNTTFGGISVSAGVSYFIW